MNLEFFLKSKKRTVHNLIKSIVSLLIITAMMTPIVPVQAEIKKTYDPPEAYWKNYPYYPPGTDIVFPTDEGSHDTQQFPIEWWYVNFHLTGQTTGDEYGSFVAFYKIQTNVADKKEIRIFSISDLTNEKTYTNIQIGTLTANSEHLDLNFAYFINQDETDKITIQEADTKNYVSENIQGVLTNDTKSTMNTMNQSSTIEIKPSENVKKINPIDEYDINYQENYNGILQYDRWYTKLNNQGLLPFNYSLDVSGKSEQTSKLMKLDVDIDSLKKPLIIGGDGIIFYGAMEFSYYYSLTKLLVTGKITLNDVTENVVGNAWIDHQWGNFVNQNPPPWGLTMTYEWFSIQLQDNQEIVVGDTWDRITGEKINKSYTDGLNICNNDGYSEILKNYSITPRGFWNDTGDNHFYSCQWHLTETSKSIDLNVTPVFSNQMMRFTENYPLLQEALKELFPGACFWEGVCIVNGTINGTEINGRAYVELTHYYTFQE